LQSIIAKYDATPCFSTVWRRFLQAIQQHESVLIRHGSMSRAMTEKT